MLGVRLTLSSRRKVLRLILIHMGRVKVGVLGRRLISKQLIKSSNNRGRRRTNMKINSLSNSRRKDKVIIGISLKVNQLLVVFVIGMIHHLMMSPLTFTTGKTVPC